MKIITPSQMKRMDQRTVEEGLFSSLRLMQNAAEALYRSVSALMEERGYSRVLLLAGGGSNGGDAYALACLLHPLYQPAVLPIDAPKSEDCIYYAERCKKLGVPIVSSPAGFDLVVDGVFGTGFRGELPPKVQELFAQIDAPVVAIDLPSGMDGNSGCFSKGTLRPIQTITFAFKKPCHLLADCGEVILADIGIPQSYADEIALQELTPVLPKRSLWGHKNSYGAVGLSVGSAEYSGAAALAIKGALQSGVGLVYADVPQEIKPALAKKFYGPILKDGACDARLVGSGLGRSTQAEETLKVRLEESSPLVIDGDGLFHLQKHLAPRKSLTVLTPHIGEFARLIGMDKETLLQDRIEIAMEFAKKYNVILVLKDAATLVTDGVRAELLSAPCSALGKGGSGDVLAGLIAGMLAGKGEPFDLVKTAVWLHNRAAHLAAAEHSVRTLQPEQIADYIDNAWMELEDGTF